MAPDERIQAIANAHFGPANPRHADFAVYGYHLAPAIPDKLLVGACEAYAAFDFTREQPVLLMDDTVFGTGKRGLLVTDAALYWALADVEDGQLEARGRLALAQAGGLGLDGEVLQDGERPLGRLRQAPAHVAQALAAFFAAAAAAQAGPGPVRRAERPALDEGLLIDVARRALGPFTPLHGSLRNAGWFVADDIPPRKLANAREAYAAYDEARERPVLLYDLTVFGSAKRGLLLTTGALYYAMTSAEDGFSEVQGRLAVSTIKRMALVAEQVQVNDEPIGQIVKQDKKDEAAVNAFFHQIETAEQGLAPTLSPGGAQPLAEPADAIFAKIRGLKTLLDEGVLTPDEFAAKKQELLARL